MEQRDCAGRCIGYQNPYPVITREFCSPEELQQTKKT
jgi:hypothetical protein